MEKILILDKHPGSATLEKSFQVFLNYRQYFLLVLRIRIRIDMDLYSSDLLDKIPFRIRNLWIRIRVLKGH
jgi:hypothetical protein